MIYRVLRRGDSRTVDGDDVHLYHPDLHEFSWSDDFDECTIRRNGMKEEEVDFTLLEDDWPEG